MDFGKEPLGSKGHFTALSPTFRQAFMDFDKDDEGEKPKSTSDEVKDILKLASKADTNKKSSPATPAKKVTLKQEGHSKAGKAALVKSTTTHRAHVKNAQSKDKKVMDLISASRKMFRAIKQHQAKH